MERGRTVEFILGGMLLAVILTMILLVLYLDFESVESQQAFSLREKSSTTIYSPGFFYGEKNSRSVYSSKDFYSEFIEKEKMVLTKKEFYYKSDSQVQKNYWSPN